MCFEKQYINECLIFKYYFIKGADINLKKYMLITFFFILLFALTGCVKFGLINFTETSEKSIAPLSDEKEKAPLPQDTTNIEKFEGKSEFSSLNDFKEYLASLDKLSNDSYIAVSTSNDIEAETIKTELVLQNEVLDKIVALDIPFTYIKTNSRESAKSYIKSEFPSLIKERIKYMETLLNVSSINSLTKEADLLQMKNITIPMLTVAAENKFLEF